MSEPIFLAGLLNLALGFALGLVGGLLGIGGGLIAIPVLGMLYGMDQHLAQGTALVMITPNVLIGFLRYRQRSHIDLRGAAGMSTVAIAMTYLSARYATMLDARQLQLSFAVFLVALAAYFMWQLRAGAGLKRSRAPLPAAWIPAVGVISGIMSGLFTVGGGLVAVPALVGLFGMDQRQAQGMALALVIPGAVVALFGYAQAGHVSWSTGLPLAAGGIFSVSWGVTLAYRFPQAGLRMLFCAVLLGTALMMMLSS
jgi:uncharacterized protein